jgi:4-amino-4-deoxy-L-arabinose transferase-like glycosyltransferase
LEQPASSTHTPAIADKGPAAPATRPLTSPRAVEDSTWLARAANPMVALPALAALCTALYLVNLGSYPIYTKGEAREAVTVLDMFKGHSLSSFLLPMRAGVEIPSKPLLMHWLIALTSVLAGTVNEWTVRLPSALLAMMAVLVCYLYVRRLFGSLTGLFSALVLATTLQMLQAGSGARVDMTLTFFMEVAFFEFILIAEGLTSRRRLFYLAMALAVLAKGPVGLVLPLATAAAFIALERRWSLLSRLSLAEGAALVILLDVGWYLSAIAIGGAAFIYKQILAENVDTFLYRKGVSGGHGHPFYYLDLALLVGFLPWTLILPMVGVALVRARDYCHPRIRYLLVWIAVVLLFYNFAYSKRGVYLLSLYPALAALTGLTLARSCTALHQPRWVAVLKNCAALFALAAGIVGVLCIVLLCLWPAGFAVPLRWSGIVVPGFASTLAAGVARALPSALALSALLLIVGVQTARYPASVGRLMMAICVAMAALVMAANIFVVPAIARTLSLKPFSIRAARIIDGHSAAYLNYLDYVVAFYTDKRMPVQYDLDDAPPDFLITGVDVFAAKRTTALRGYKPVLQSNPTDFDGSGAFVLLQRKGLESAAVR